MRADPFSPVVPWSTGDQENNVDIEVTGNRLTDDDAVARWESEGGTTRDGQAEPRPWAVEVGG